MARVQMTQAVAADYADAMLVARRAKTVLFSCLTLVLLIQLGVFFAVRYVPGMNIRGNAAPAAAAIASAPGAPAATTVSAPVAVLAGHPSGSEVVAAVMPVPLMDSAVVESGHVTVQSTPSTSPSTSPVPAGVRKSHAITPTPAIAPPSGGASAQPTDAQQMPQWPLKYVIAATDFLGVLLPIVLSVVLLLIILIALIGKPRNLTGISHVTGAFIWSIFLVVLLFPWQSLLNSNENGAPGSGQSTRAGPRDEIPDMKIPGVLYTWPELVRDHDFPNAPMRYAILKWSRFVAFPALSLIILLMVQVRSSQGWRTAVGDGEVIVDLPR